MLNAEDREHIGRLCKMLIDQGRVHFLQQKGFDSRLLYYTSSDVSLENVLLTALPASRWKEIPLTVQPARCTGSTTLYFEQCYLYRYFPSFFLKPKKARNLFAVTENITLATEENRLLTRQKAQHSRQDYGWSQFHLKFSHLIFVNLFLKCPGN